MIILENSLGRKVKTEFMMSRDEYLVDYLPGYWGKKLLLRKITCLSFIFLRTLQNIKPLYFNMGKKNHICNKNLNIKM